MRTASQPLAVATLLALAAIAPGAVAQQKPKPEQLIKWRQSAYQVVAWNSGRIKASVEGTYDRDDVVKAANAIAAIANAGIGALFAPGTEQGKGWHDTSVKPELFQDGKRAAELSADFGREASELARVAAVGDAAVVKAQYAKLTGTCKACHDAFRVKD